MTAAPKIMTGAPNPAPDAIRVMLVDDSAVVRGMVSRWLSAEAGIAVVASCLNGKIAVDAVEKAQPDIIVLDIEMPEMDGLTALPLLLKRAPKARVLMASTLTIRNAEVSMRALSMGATDTIAKPSSVSTPDAGEAFRRELVAKIRGLGARRPRGSVSTTPVYGATPSTPAPAGPPKLRPIPVLKPKVLCIGSSTGGPQALNAVFAGLPAKLGVPILVTQHMPPTFTQILAKHLGGIANRPSCEAANGMPLEPDHIYVAPGDKHLLLRRDDAKVSCVLTMDPPEHFCRPAVDPMFRSAAKIYGKDVLGVVLTGMGADGRNGAQAIADAGGAIIVQDEATSVVWGMPGAVATANLASGIFPLNSIAGEVRKIFSGLAS
jgi:two-component system, chemotaxis family, protein-glutamate methylesterase/glutaminase